MNEGLEIRDIRKKEWFVVDNIYINGYAKHLNPLTALTYFALCRHANIETQQCFPSMELIAEELNVSKPTIIKAIKELEKWNIISVTREKTIRKNGHQTPNIYTLLDKSVWKEKTRVNEIYPDSRVNLTTEQSKSDSKSRVNEVYYNNTNNNNTHKNKTKEQTRFVHPSLEEVTNYCKERKNNISAQGFIDYYESNGWKVGRNPMKDWKAAVRNWENKRFDSKTTKEKSNKYANHKIIQASE